MKMLFSGKNLKILQIFESQNCKFLQDIAGILLHQIVWEILQKECSIIVLILQISIPWFKDKLFSKVVLTSLERKQLKYSCRISFYKNLISGKKKFSKNYVKVEIFNFFQKRISLDYCDFDLKQRPLLNNFIAWR